MLIEWILAEGFTRHTHRHPPTPTDGAGWQTGRLSGGVGLAPPHCQPTCCKATMTTPLNKSSGQESSASRRGRRAWLALFVWPASLPLAMAAGAPGAPAEPLAPPKGPVLLSITGQVGSTNAAGRADFDMAMLDAMAQHSHTMATPWYKAAHRFSGPLLRDVLAAAGANGQRLLAVALNNYKVEIPFEDVQRHRVMLATRFDDRPMGVRDKGPLFVVYPYHERAELRSERYYSRSIWQLRSIEVR
jgi:hypothetical protein